MFHLLIMCRFMRLSVLTTSLLVAGCLQSLPEEDGEGSGSTTEVGSTGTGEPATTEGGRCGDGVVDAGEGCGDGNGMEGRAKFGELAALWTKNKAYDCATGARLYCFQTE